MLALVWQSRSGCSTVWLFVWEELPELRAVPPAPTQPQGLGDTSPARSARDQSQQGPGGGAEQGGTGL